MANIFISHSRKDKEIIAFFDSIFSGSKVKSVKVEFEKIKAEAIPSITIRKKIKQSKAAFVLLGPNVELTIYTRNWISFEIGLAAALGKPIWVFEPIQSNIKFPIPYLNHYMQYELEYDREYITSIVKAYEKSKVEPPDGFIVKCSYDNCKLPFMLHTKTYSFNCPACRQPLQINSLDSPTKKYYYQDPITGLDERMVKESSKQ